jgi:hypothetical protein
VVILIREWVIKMKFDKRSKGDLSKYLMYGAVVAVLLSAEGWIGPDIWLASTQWLLIAVVLGLFGVYLKLS